MPPYELWLSGRDQIFGWWWGVGIGCKGSRLLPPGRRTGCRPTAQYKPDGEGGFVPWALQVIELSGDRVKELTFFLDVDRLFPLWNLPLTLEP